MFEFQYYPSDLLLKPCANIERIDDNIKSISEHMFKVCAEKSGIGLAANQIGLPYNMFVVHLPIHKFNKDEMKEVFINPVVIDKTGTRQFTEACLSCPGVQVITNRSETISLLYKNLKGQEVEREFKDLPALVVQHELEHLEGRLILDHASTVKRKMLERHIARHVKREKR